MTDTDEKANELKEKYKSIPDVLKGLKRWCGYKIQEMTDKTTGEKRVAKLPFNAVTGSFAKSNDENTWTDFETAIYGIVIYGFDGLGIMLGDGITGIDLDNHADTKTGELPLTDEQFREWGEYAVGFMDSYAEWSPSGKGIHILCNGEMPKGKNRSHKVVDGLRRDVEMYGYKRFFTVTGKVIHSSDFSDRTDRLYEFWKKYVDDSDELSAERNSFVPTAVSNLSDNEIINKAIASKNGSDFLSLYNGNLSDYNDDHSAADLAFCDKLAFWCNGNAGQMDRIFRSSKLMRDKWDRAMKDTTYGALTINEAISHMKSGYQKKESHEFPNVITVGDDSDFVQQGLERNPTDPVAAVCTFDDDGNPLFIDHTGSDGNSYTYDDTGNAERFYSYFGSLFKYNKTSKCFMVWTGKMWKEDVKNCIVKCIIRMSDEMKCDIDEIKARIVELYNDDSMEEEEKKMKKKELSSSLDTITKNIAHVRSSKGMDSLQKVLSSLKDIPSVSTDYDRTDQTGKSHYINTESGIVCLETGEITPFDKSKMLSMTTGHHVSYERSEVWESMLEKVFQQGDGETEEEKKETEKMILVFQKIMGLTLAGDTREQKFFLLSGEGSNGKSTLLDALYDAMGDYAATVDSSILISQKNSGSNNNVQYSLATIKGKRFVLTSETDIGEKLSEKTVKSLAGCDNVVARDPYGKPFSYKPQFNIFMATNNLPIISGQDNGIWRRIYPIPFMHTFTKEDRDADMPFKLSQDADKILGWCIQGYIKYVSDGIMLDDMTPLCVERLRGDYRHDSDVITCFLERCCHFNTQERANCMETYTAFKLWALDNCVNASKMPENKFFNRLKKKGYGIATNASGADLYVGFSLLPQVLERVRGGKQFKSEDSKVTILDYDFRRRNME